MSTAGGGLRGGPGDSLPGPQETDSVWLCSPRSWRGWQLGIGTASGSPLRAQVFFPREPTPLSCISHPPILLLFTKFKFSKTAHFPPPPNRNLWILCIECREWRGFRVLCYVQDGWCVVKIMGCGQSHIAVIYPRKSKQKGSSPQSGRLANVYLFLRTFMKYLLGTFDVENVLGPRVVDSVNYIPIIWISILNI